MAVNRSARPPTVLVLRALGLGDLLTAVPALRALRRARPDHRLVMAAPRALTPLARRAGVDAVVHTVGLDTGVAAPSPAIAVNLHGRGPQSTAALRALRPGTLITHAEDPADTARPQWGADLHEVDRWCRLLDAHGVPADPTELTLDGPPAGPRDGPGPIVVHPGAASAARRWPVDRFAAVVRALARRRPEAPIVITGGPGEEGRAEEVAARAGLAPGSVRAGRTDLTALDALVAGARLVVCGDTGVAHLATAHRVRSVLLFGPTDPAGWGPRIAPHLHRVLWAGRTGDPHADRPDPGLLEITAEQVLTAVEETETADV